ncbi:S-DNA-T family DNA segregation ATPase FtsK/SpoIIIE [Tamaricihabitans halophyticus]|uniref:S-DNA-T family DNA segregation ATPase FtsK/SpoIIIE n=1 Tax=Tamaricihabitans halophyticus TaxID=1262583 RepID=A0A4R2R4W8_9PSEU|nr:FtsK/SpoIIIE domain-containing protein [Tamaricihabitans halophyticus]TCP56974.1 S-DNA-T family DNA segregation ATPase FtsK/SpoIIIE [Tamaricihabitans halophyticus]
MTSAHEPQPDHPTTHTPDQPADQSNELDTDQPVTGQADQAATGQVIPLYPGSEIAPTTQQGDAATTAGPGATGKELVPDDALEGEIVEEDEDEDGQPRQPVAVDSPAERDGSSFMRRVATSGSWQPVVPQWVRNRQELAERARWVTRYCGHASAYHALRTPKYAMTLLAHSPRGVWRVTTTACRWVYDTEQKPLRDAARDRSNTDEYLRLLREHDNHVRHRLLLAVPVALGGLGGLAALLAYGTPALWLATALVVTVVFGLLGRRPDKPVIGRAVVTQKAQKLTSDMVVRALSALGISQVNQAVTKGPGITFPSPITRDGPGWRAEVDLPHGVVVTDILERRDKLASGLRRPLGCVWPEAVSDEHAGRLVIWVGDQEMSKAKSPSWPLAKNGGQRVDLFSPVPFGTDQRGRPVGVDLVFNNMVIGAMPRMGKTFSLRVLVLAAALDPTVELRLFELKGTGDLGMFEPVAHDYASGPDDETLERAMNSLRELYKDLERRSKVITHIAKTDRAACPENKVTPDLSRNPKLGLHLVFAAIDECQELFSHDDYKDEAKKLAEGLIKRGPAMGIILVLATQRPDAQSLPPGVSANAGLRYCLRVMGQTENDMVLGTSAYKNGTRATTFTAKDKGIGYLVGATDDPIIARSYYIDGPAAEKIVATARALREKAGTITGHAAGEAPDTETARINTLEDVASVFDHGDDKLWSEVIVQRLAELRPQVYQGWKPAQLATALKPFDLAPGQVWMDDNTGKARNRNGYTRDAITTAINNRK